MFQCCIFDLDGTLINSLEDLADACNWVLRENGLPTHPVDAYRRFVGDGAYKLAERMLPESMRDQQTAARYKALFDQRYNGHYLDKTRPYPGILELLAHLKKKGVQLAVLSNKPNQFVQKTPGLPAPALAGDSGDGRSLRKPGRISLRTTPASWKPISFHKPKRAPLRCALFLPGFLRTVIRRSFLRRELVRIFFPQDIFHKIQASFHSRQGFIVLFDRASHIPDAKEYILFQAV